MRISDVMRLVPLITLSACASIIGGSSQSVSVKTTSGTTDVNGAQCTLTNDKGVWYTTSPGSVTVHRSFNDLNVKCEHDGYIANAGNVPSGTRAMMLGNILFGGLIGVAVDAGTGSAYDYPAPIIINLQPTKTTEVERFKGS
jgi:hypothetical protein